MDRDSCFAALSRVETALWATVRAMATEEDPEKLADLSQTLDRLDTGTIRLAEILAGLGPKSELPADPRNPHGGTRRVHIGLYIAADTGEWYVSTGAAWTKIGQIGIPVDASGNVAVAGTLAVTGAANFSGNTSIGGHLSTSSTSVPSALTPQAGAGTTPPAAVLVAGSNDTAGRITWGTGTSPAAGDQATVTFGTPYAAAPKAVVVLAGNLATSQKAPFYATCTATDFTFGLATAPAASQANTIYALAYFVIA